MPVLTNARSGIARSGATRSGYPIVHGVMVPLYALSGVARAGATRSNYHSPKAFIAIDGVQYGHAGARGVKYDSLSITDTLGATPNIAQCRTYGVIPTLGQDVVITLGSVHNLAREFGGQILQTAFGYFEKSANYHTDLNLIDYTWGLNKLKVTERYLSATVATIAADLVATYAPGYTVRIAADIGAESVDVITFTEQDLTACLTQLTKRVGGDWVCDYHKVVSLFFRDASVTDPTILNAVNTLFTGFSVSRDLSQFLTRVLFEGGGGNALADCVAGSTILPVENGAWYPLPGVVTDGPYTVTSGVVTAGPQHVAYTGVDLGGGGGLVGPGAAPSSAPILALAGGAGMTTGAHNVAVTFVTASGESLASPIAAITVGTVAVPVTAPTAGTPTIGTGPDPGVHDYAVTFVTAVGETTAGPRIENVATTFTPAPSSAPTPGTPTSGGSVDPGNHDYAVTFVTSIGETPTGPISGQVTTAADVTVADPSDSPTAAATIGSGWAGHSNCWRYAYTLVNVNGETLPGPRGAGVGYSGANSAFDRVVPTGPPGTIARKLYRQVTAIDPNAVSTLFLVATISGNSPATFADATPDTSLGAEAPSSNTTTITGNRTVPLTGIPTGGTGVTSRKLYRRSGGAGLKLLATIANNTATTYTDTTPNASLGAAASGSNTAYVQRIPLTAIPTGGALVTSRKIYRSAAGGGQLKLAATLSDNTTTAWTDTVTDASLGANVPTSNTTAANQIAISGIPIGAASVTSRKIYMTAAAGSQLKLVAPIADNATSTYTISMADGSLGANVPTSDASGLAQPSGQVLAGSTSIVVAGTGPFSSTGGWAVIGNGAQVIRYTGKTGSTLTGIPASGVGAIVASVGYNSTITASPQLTGIPASGPGSIQFTILKGDPVNLFVQVDDLAAQTALASYIGGDGVQEDFLQDRRMASTEAIARAEAQLALRNTIEVSIRYRTRDINTRAGRTIAVNLGPPFSIVAEFMIQSVTETFPQTRPQTNPLHDVVASNSRFSFDDLLRLARRGA